MLRSVSLPARRESYLETNLARFGGWQVGTEPEKEVRRVTFLGAAIAAGAPLGPLELDSLSWLCARWYEQRSPEDGLVTFTLYELGADLYGREPSGKERRLMRRAIEHLAAVLVTLGGYNAHSGETSPTLQSMVHLVESVVWNEALDMAVFNEFDHSKVGGLRGDTFQLKLAPWLVRQLEAKYFTRLNWRLQRRLDGLAKRLWVYLEAERFKAVGQGRERAYIVLGDKAYAALDVHYSRDRAARAALARAGEKIVKEDDHYESIDVERNPTGPGWRLMITRRGAEARRAHRAILESLAD